MNIKRGALAFNNVLSAELRCNVDTWYQQYIFFNNSVIENKLYATGPIIYKVFNFDKNTNEADYIFYLPINKEVEVEPDSMFKFQKKFVYEDGLSLRHVYLDEDIEKTNNKIRECAKLNNFKLEEPFYNIYLDVYGGGIIEVYAPILEDNSSDK